ncbi:MAG TPA: hypothetical protein PKM97_06255 [Bacteroidia bacterium]|nr:hypothetical protein [Bacteroidia bacterium]
MKFFLLLALSVATILPVQLYSQDPEPFELFPEITSSGESIQSFIPQGWSLRDSSSGLLDDDELLDFAIVIQLDDTLLLSKILGDDTMTEEYRPRILMILSKTADNTFRKSCQSNQAILAENEGGMLGDPFQSLEIKNHELSFSFKGGAAVEWGLAYHFRYSDGAFYLFQALSNGKGQGETYQYEYNLLTGELSIEIRDEKDPRENMKYSKIREASDQPKLENFLPLSYVVDESEGIIF